MALPASQFSATPVPADFESPDDRMRTSLLVDYELGGVALGDPSEGLQVQVWEARVEADEIQTRPEGVGAWTTVTSDTGITEVALAFDQNMRASVSYVAAGVAKHYWYDAQIADFRTSVYTGAASPVVSMDDKRELEIGLNDVVLFYLLDGRVKYRRQRDRFLIEYDMADIPDGMTRVLRWGMSVGKRFQLEFGTDDDIVEPEPEDGPSFGTAYTDLLTDALYVVSGVEIVPFFAAAEYRAGLWKSPIIVQRQQHPYAWLRVNGTFAGDAPVTVRAYANGALWFTRALTGRAPVRVPPGRFEHLEVEVAGQGVVTSVMLATTAEDLR